LLFYIIKNSFLENVALHQSFCYCALQQIYFSPVFKEDKTMNANMTETYRPAAETATHAANSAGQLMVKNIGKMIELQMGSAKVYADALLNNTREALEIKDAQSARSYFEKQPEVVRGLVQRMTKDSGEIMELSRAYVDEAQALFTQSAANLGTVMEKGTKTGGKAA
tara:strand:+ start:187 stop:687 length:501 start_codon:yes stop_codon:yes gene_type:complete